VDQLARNCGARVRGPGTDGRKTAKRGPIDGRGGGGPWRGMGGGRQGRFGNPDGRAGTRRVRLPNAPNVGQGAVRRRIGIGRCGGVRSCGGWCGERRMRHRGHPAHRGMRSGRSVARRRGDRRCEAQGPRFGLARGERVVVGLLGRGHLLRFFGHALVGAATARRQWHAEAEASAFRQARTGPGCCLVEDRRGGGLRNAVLNRLRPGRRERRCPISTDISRLLGSIGLHHAQPGRRPVRRCLGPWLAEVFIHR
jgi:hypothetical protein